MYKIDRIDGDRVRSFKVLEQNIEKEACMHW